MIEDELYLKADKDDHVYELDESPTRSMQVSIQGHRRNLHSYMPRKYPTFHLYPDFDRWFQGPIAREADVNSQYGEGREEEIQMQVQVHVQMKVKVHSRVVLTDDEVARVYVCLFSVLWSLFFLVRVE